MHLLESCILLGDRDLFIAGLNILKAKTQLCRSFVVVSDREPLSFFFEVPMADVLYRAVKDIPEEWDKILAGHETVFMWKNLHFLITRSQAPSAGSHQRAEELVETSTLVRVSRENPAAEFNLSDFFSD